MATPYYAEIKIVSFNFAPQGWALCNGQFLPINQNQALFSILGTTYGGNGQTTFALPDLRGRVPIHTGVGHTLGEKAGEEAHTLTINEMPTHVHTVNSVAAATTGGKSNNPVASYLSNSTPNEIYNAAGGGQTVTMGAATLANTGSSQPHNNLQPYLTLNFCIALLGEYPSQN